MSETPIALVKKLTVGLSLAVSLYLYFRIMFLCDTHEICSYINLL